MNLGKKNQTLKEVITLKKEYEDMEKINILNENFYTRLIVETEEGQKAAEITLPDATPAGGYRIKLTPKYDYPFGG